MHLRILCFGASITAGLNQAGKYFYPYSTKLSARLNEAFPSIQFTVDVDGIGGDSVTRGHYLQRMNNDIHHANPPYDWVIVQAGGNDLDFPESAETIVEKIASVWSVALNAGANVLALTVTEHASVKAAENEKMQMINTLVSNHKENGYYVADTAKALPWAAMSVANRKKFRDDNVHFTRAGYVLLGDTIADRLIQLIKEHSTTGISPRRAKAEESKLNFKQVKTQSSLTTPSQLQLQVSGPEGTRRKFQS